MSRRKIVDVSLLWVVASFFAGSILFLFLVAAPAHASKSEPSGSKEDYQNSFAVAAYLPDYRIHDYLSKYVTTTSNAERNDGIQISTGNIPYNGTIATSVLTDLILFSLQPHSRGFLGGCCLQEDHYDLVRKFRRSIASSIHRVDHDGNNGSNPNELRVWVTLGGGGRTEAFPEICADEKRRKRLIDAVMKLW